MRRGLCRAVALYVLTSCFAPNLGQPNLRNGRYGGAKRRLIPGGKAVCLPIVMTLEAKLPSEIITFIYQSKFGNHPIRHSSFVNRQSSMIRQWLYCL